MIDKLIKRIAARRPTQPATSVSEASEIGLLAQALPSDAMSGDLTAEQDVLHDPFHAAYVAARPAFNPHTGQTRPGSDSAWHIALQGHLRKDISQLMSSQLAYFSSWGAAHLAVAQLIWSERAAMNSRLMHITCADQLLAVVIGSQKEVAIHAPSFHPRTPLLWTHQSSNNQPMLAFEKKPFQTHHMHALMWFFGQVYPAISESIPSEIASGRIQLRRFPQVAPAGLEMRHLGLIHLFSRGALSFTQLERQVEPENRSHLCADITSLFLTGTLRFLPPLASA
jgi:hypothetical protein